MGVFDTDNGPVDETDDGPDEFEENGGDNPDRRDSAGDDDGSGEEDGEPQGDRDGTPEKNRRRNRPGVAKRQAERIRGLESKLDSLIQAISKGGLAVDLPKGSTGENQTIDVEAMRREISQEVEGKANLRVLRTEARSALKEAGFKGDVARGIRMLDLDGIDPDDGDALIDAIEDLKDESPGLFGRVRRTSRDRDDDDSEDTRERDSRPSRSRERMSRSRDNGGGERDALAETLIRAVGSRR